MNESLANLLNSYLYMSLCIYHTFPVARKEKINFFLSIFQIERGGFLDICGKTNPKKSLPGTMISKFYGKSFDESSIYLLFCRSGSSYSSVSKILSWWAANSELCMS